MNTDSQSTTASSDAFKRQLHDIIDRFRRGKGNLTVLTGAGISAESGIPTFRGPQGYWAVGSQVYRPQEMATFEMFQRDPKAVWPFGRKAAPCSISLLDICRGLLTDLEPGQA
jgi:NAD-dependent SIR2 family protein deacetylase